MKDYGSLDLIDMRVTDGESERERERDRARKLAFRFSK